MHDTQEKFLARDSDTSSWAENLGHVPWALGSVPKRINLHQRTESANGSSNKQNYDMALRTAL